jgi:phosphatidylglycerol---prolipoprotein diacylglyceryl transferase
VDQTVSMHFPFAIQVGEVKILLHTIFETAAFFVGFRYFLYLRKRQGDVIQSPTRIWIIIGAIFGSLIGSRLLGGLEDIDALQQAFNKPLYFYQNKTVVGGFLGGLFGVELIKKIIKERNASGDLFAYPMILALIIGRIGCFSMGIYEETYGAQSNLPWAMNLGDGILRHPVCLYEIIFLFLLWMTIIQVEKRYTLENGARFKLFMIGYLLFRFTLDFIKPRYTFSIGLSTIQLACLLGLAYYGKYIIHPARLLATVAIKNVATTTTDKVIATQR